ncbi:MAG: aminotransferase class IV [Planctomycetes bacterium]|nr:aminotransferase class IV [Planctomycetota bacterium]
MTDAPGSARCERIRAWRGRLELLGEHVARLLALERAALRDGPPHPLELAVQERFAASGRADGVVTLLASSAAPHGPIEIRGPEPFDFASEALAGGLALLSAGTRPPLPAAKELERLAAARAQLAQARVHGADELLWSGADGALLGATTMSLFVVEGATLRTPSLASGAWDSLLRRAVLHAARELAPALGFTLHETRLDAAALARADDLFLAGSALGVVPVRSVDGRALPPAPRGAPARKLVPQLKLRLHELCAARFLPDR